MRLTSRARCALRLMVEVAVNGVTGRPVSLTEVARRTGISRGYLEQLALALRNARLVNGVAGRYGGYRLTEPAQRITVGQIVEAATRSTGIVGRVDDPPGRSREEFLDGRPVDAIVEERISEVLREFTLADLLEESRIARRDAAATQLPGSQPRRRA